MRDIYISKHICARLRFLKDRLYTSTLRENLLALCLGLVFRLLSETTRKSLYYTLIYPYLTYCTTVWSSTYVTNLNIIFLLQKRAVRIIRNSDFHAHSESLFFRLRILAIYNINSFYAAQFMFSYYHQLLPPLSLDLFVTSRHIHNYNTRISSHFRSHACRTNTKQFTILFQGPKIWNSLPNSITSICICNRLKRKFFFFYYIDNALVSSVVVC